MRLRLPIVQPRMVESVCPGCGTFTVRWDAVGTPVSYLGQVVIAHAQECPGLVEIAERIAAQRRANS